VLARGPALSSYDEARDSALDMAQKGLDFFSIAGFEDLSIVNSDEVHIAWWTEEEQGVILRVYTVDPIQTPLLYLGWQIVDKGGTSWNESLRYYRLSQITSDLFDAYRNIYLAMESILSDVASNPKKGEGEWLMEAIKQIESKLDLKRFIRNPSASDPVEEFFNEFWKDRRNHVFHAKSHKPHFVPHSPDKREELLDSLRRLTQLYLEILRISYGKLRQEGGMDSQAFKERITALEDSFQILVCNQETVFTRKVIGIDQDGTYIEDDIQYESGPLIPLTIRRMPQLDSDYMAYFLGVTPGSDMDSVEGKTEIWTIRKGRDSRKIRIADDLTFDGIVEFQVLLGVRLQNIREPKQYYST
jgi:hypothetical protein